MRIVLALIGAMLILAGCGERGSVGGLLVLDDGHRIEDGTTLFGDLLVLDGEVTLLPGGRITGSAFVLGGDVTLAGAVDGDVAIVGGRVTLAESVVVAGGLRRGGGVIDQAPGASVGSELVSPVAVDAVIGLTRPAAGGDGIGPWTLLQVLLAGLLAAVAGRLAPRAVGRMAATVRAQPLVPLAVGVLGLVVGISLLVFMVFTVVLVPVALLLLLAGVVGSWIGFVSLGLVAFRRALGPAALRGRVNVQAGIGSLGLAVLVVLLAQVPVVGEITVSVVAATALGAWLATRFGTRELVAPPA
jgi:hypothetical protein